MGNSQTTRGIAASLVDDLIALRRAVREIEEEEHPDLVDAFGRTWTWKSHDLYVHDSMAWPRDSVLSPTIGWPSASVLDNPNYRWCDTCKTGGEQR